MVKLQTLGYLTQSRNKKKSPKIAKASGPGDIPSPLAGRVVAINVQVGQSVKDGDCVVFLEAASLYSQPVQWRSDFGFQV